MKHVIHKNNKTSLIEIVIDSMGTPVYISIGEGNEYSIEGNVIYIRNMEQETLKKINAMNELYIMLKRCLYNNGWDHDKKVKQFNKELFQDIQKGMVETIQMYDNTGDEEIKRIYQDFLIEWYVLISSKDRKKFVEILLIPILFNHITSFK
jgi:NADPH:quinone reductase-like Zn-dependent oxidoreductase